MTGRARRQARRTVAAMQAQQQTRTADLPAVAQHPAAPPLDTAMLTEPIVLSPNLAQPAEEYIDPSRYATRRPSPTPISRPPAPHPQQQRVDGPYTPVQYTALRLLERLVTRDGEEALCADVVDNCKRAAERLLK